MFGTKCQLEGRIGLRQIRAALQNISHAQVRQSFEELEQLKDQAKQFLQHCNVPEMLRQVHDQVTSSTIQTFQQEIDKVLENVQAQCETFTAQACEVVRTCVQDLEKERDCVLQDQSPTFSQKHFSSPELAPETSLLSQTDPTVDFSSDLQPQHKCQ